LTSDLTDFVSRLKSTISKWTRVALSLSRFARKICWEIFFKF